MLCSVLKHFTTFSSCLAIRIFQSIGDVAMVWTLKGLLFIEDQLTLAGYVAALTGDFDAADELFTRSDCPIEAMEVCIHTYVYVCV